MGAAPRTVQTAELTPDEARDSEREWFLDTGSGELKPEGSAGPQEREGPEGGRIDEDSRDLPKAVRVARWIFD